MAKKGLYHNIHAKRARIAAGSGEKMRKVGQKGAPTADNFKQAAKTAKKAKSGGKVYANKTRSAKYV
jgi:signal recognition particle GTPase